MSESIFKFYVTCHVQKDGRINLGTARHKDPKCSALRQREIVDVSGSILSKIPICKVCG